MKTWVKITISVFAVIAIVWTLLVAGFIYLFSGMCGSELYQTVPSPNGKYKAVIYQFDCGATTDFSTQVSILAANEELEANAGNILSAAGHPKDTALQLSWVSDEQLNIHQGAGVRVHQKELSWSWLWHKIKITYD